MPSVVTLTAAAAQAVTAMLKAKGLAEGVLRLKVTPGGCSGLSYSFALEPESKPDDLVVEAHGARLALDRKTAFFVGGSRLDYVRTFTKTGFEISNPNASSTCGCGESFSAGASAFGNS